MGIGDDIMWRGEAYKKFKETGELQRPWNNKKEQYMNIETREVWKNVSWISRKGKPLDTLPNNQRRWYYNGTPYKPKVAPFEFKKEQLYNKDGFKGLHGEFLIENNISKHKLKIYKVSEKKFIEVY